MTKQNIAVPATSRAGMDSALATSIEDDHVLVLAMVENGEVGDFRTVGVPPGEGDVHEFLWALLERHAITDFVGVNVSGKPLRFMQATGVRAWDAGEHTTVGSAVEALVAGELEPAGTSED